MSRNYSEWDKPKSAYSLGKHVYEIQLLKRIQEQTRLQEEQRRALEEERKLLDRQRQRQMEQRYDAHREEAKRYEAKRQEEVKRQEDHIARINCMSEEEKDRIYKQMIKEREDDKRDYILKYGFDKWEKWQRYKLEHDL